MVEDQVWGQVREDGPLEVGAEGALRAASEDWTG